MAPAGPCKELGELLHGTAWVEELAGPVFTSEAEIRTRQNHYERIYACLSDLQELRGLIGQESGSDELKELKQLVEWLVLFTGTPENTVLPRLTVLNPAARDSLREFLDTERVLVDLQTSTDPAVRRLRDAGLEAPRGFIYVRFFRDRDHLPESLKAAFSGEAVAGVTLPGGRYIAILKKGSGTDAEQRLEQRETPKTLSHELVHAYINARFPATKRSLPRWFQEGAAIYLSGGGHADQEVAVDASGSTEIRRIEPTEDYRGFGLAFAYLENKVGRSRLDRDIRETVEKQDAGILLADVSAATDEDLMAKARNWDTRRELLPWAGFLVLLLALGAVFRQWLSNPLSSPQPARVDPAHAVRTGAALEDRRDTALPADCTVTPLTPRELIDYFHSIVGHRHAPTAEELEEAKRMLDLYGEDASMQIVKQVVSLWERHGLEPQSFQQLDDVLEILLAANRPAE
ncbi:MAG: hypothetical protein WBL61_24540 [Bryobacteraceae bacterium]